MKKSEEKKLEKFLPLKLTAEQQVKVKGGSDGNPPDWEFQGIIDDIAG